MDGEWKRGVNFVTWIFQLSHQKSTENLTCINFTNIAPSNIPAECPYSPLGSGGTLCLFSSCGEKIETKNVFSCPEHSSIFTIFQEKITQFPLPASIILRRMLSRLVTSAPIGSNPSGFTTIISVDPVFQIVQFSELSNLSKLCPSFRFGSSSVWRV